VRRHLHRRNFAKPAVLELLAVAIAFLGMYFVLPFAYGDASYIDVRALAVAPLFLMLACLHLPDRDGPTRGIENSVALAMLLAAANLAFLGWHMAKDGRWMTQYRTVVAAIPRGASVLPLYPGTNTVRAYMHAASFAVIDRGAVIPYLFSANRGNPQTYFRYDTMPYAPSEEWYYSVPPASNVDWERILCSYDYLLVMKPFDLGRVPIPSRLVRENEQAALRAIGRQPCARR